MNYQKYPSSLELQPFIECYFIWEGQTCERMEVQSPPSGFSAMVFNYADHYWAYQYSSKPHPVPKCFVSGQFTSNYHLVMEGKIGMVGIVFKASSMNNFFNWNMPALVNNRISLELLMGKEACKLYKTVAEELSHDNRIIILDNFLKSRLQQAKSRLSIIDDSVSYIDEQNGLLTIESVAAHLKISRRYLEKKFLEKVGISPKLYSRIKRFSILSNKVARLQKVDWQDVVFESGYHDQSHLVKEFKEFNQMNPGDYHHQHLELIRWVNK